MPHKTWTLTTVTATQDEQPASLIPGIEPGGSRVGQSTKPVLLIRNVWFELTDLVPSVTVDFHHAVLFLKLSQEVDLSPGLILPIAGFGHIGHNLKAGATDQPTVGAAYPVEQMGQHLAGTIWAPRVVGIRTLESGGMNFTGVVHLDYEAVDVPWMDWFIMWEFLDNVADNARDY